jgi:hypothetical protein
MPARKSGANRRAGRLNTGFVTWRPAMCRYLAVLFVLAWGAMLPPASAARKPRCRLTVVVPRSTQVVPVAASAATPLAAPQSRPAPKTSSAPESSPAPSAAQPKKATRVVRLRVARYTTTSLTDAEADAILKAMSETLQINHGPGDVECDIVFRRRGHVSVFTVGDGKVDTQPEYNALNAQVDAEVIVVDEINWCRIASFGFLGCSNSPGTKLIVVRHTADEEGILWAHEYGHNKGLPDRNVEHFVMCYYVAATHQRINMTERAAYLGAVGSGGGGSAAQPRPAQKVDVATFVRRTYFHGVPWDEASQYKADDVPVLLKMLASPNEKRFHSNIVTTLALIGDERAVDPLIQLISKGDERLTKPEYDARRNAILHLGTLYNKTKSKKALTYLLQGVQEPAVWQQRLQWKPAKDQAPKEFTKQLTAAAMWGLALSGSDQAKLVLGQDKTNEAVANEALQVLETVRAEGVLGYYAKKHKDHE